MNQNEYRQLVANIVPEVDSWLSGVYILQEAPFPAVIYAASSLDVFDVSVHIYSHLGYGPSCFFIHERIVWPVGSEKAFRYSLCDETRLELDREIPISEILKDVDTYDIGSENSEEIARLFAPFLTPLILKNEYEGDVNKVFEDDVEGFEKEYPGLLGLDTPNFW